MNADRKKQLAAGAALEYVIEDQFIGIGTGSTVNLFIDAMAARKLRIRGAVSSSEASTARLKTMATKAKKSSKKKGGKKKAAKKK